jgi:hypothetical protein
MIENAKIDGQIEGVVPHLVDGGLCILWYVRDTILFMEHDFEIDKNLKLILAAFKQLLVLKIDFCINELFCFDEAQDTSNQYANLFSSG